MRFELPGINMKEETALKLFHAMLIASAVLLFLPYWIISIYAGVAAFLCLLIKPLRKHIFTRKGSATAFVFITIAAAISLAHWNYIGFARTCVFIAVLILVFIARATMTRKFYERLLDFVCLGGGISTIVCIVERAYYWENPVYRCQAFFTNPNFFGAASVFVIFICAYKIAVRVKHYMFYSLIAMFVAVGVYLCGSMSLWAVTCLGVTLLFLLTRQYRLLFIFLGAVAVAVVAITILPQLMPRLNEVSDTFGYRKTVWRLALEHCKDYPLLGRGFYTFKFLYDTLHETQYFYHAALAHNIFLDAFLCHGIVGVALITATVVQYFRSLFACQKQRRLNKKHSPIAAFIISVSIAVACYGLIDTTFVWIQTGLILLFIATGLGAEENELEQLTSDTTDNNK